MGVSAKSGYEKVDWKGTGSDKGRATSSVAGSSKAGSPRSSLDKARTEEGEDYFGLNYRHHGGVGGGEASEAGHASDGSGLGKGVPGRSSLSAHHASDAGSDLDESVSVFTTAYDFDSPLPPPSFQSYPGSRSYQKSPSPAPSTTTSSAPQTHHKTPAATKTGDITALTIITFILLHFVPIISFWTRLIRSTFGFYLSTLIIASISLAISSFLHARKTQIQRIYARVQAHHAYKDGVSLLVTLVTAYTFACLAPFFFRILHILNARVPFAIGSLLIFLGMVGTCVVFAVLGVCGLAFFSWDVTKVVHEVCLQVVRIMSSTKVPGKEQEPGGKRGRRRRRMGCVRGGTDEEDEDLEGEREEDEESMEGEYDEDDDLTPIDSKLGFGCWPVDADDIEMKTFHSAGKGIPMAGGTTRFMPPPAWYAKTVASPSPPASPTAIKKRSPKSEKLKLSNPPSPSRLYVPHVHEGGLPEAAEPDGGNGLEISGAAGGGGDHDDSSSTPTLSRSSSIADRRLGIY